MSGVAPNSCSHSIIILHDITSKMSASQFERHECLYFTLVTFLVENRLFSVPRGCLTQSKVFDDLFLLPLGAHEAEGQSDTNPVVLEGIKKEDFESLIKVLRPMPFTSLPSSLPLMLEQWKGVLRLSKMWSFDTVYRHAIDQMGSLLAKLPLDKVVLSKECGVTEWLVPGLMELARRSEPVGIEDVEKLGLETALKLAEVRESFQQVKPVHQPFGYRNPSEADPIATRARGATSCDFTNRIHEVFGLTVLGCHSSETKED